jgi:RNA polymerase sigma-70 factor (ECF subfamily)
MDVSEVARCLGIPEATVRSRFFRAQSMLRELLAQDFDAAERDVFSIGGKRCDRIVAAVLERLQAR